MHELARWRDEARWGAIDEVAEILGVSAFTVRNHTANAHREFGARDRLEMVLVEIRHGLI